MGKLKRIFNKILIKLKQTLKFKSNYTISTNVSNFTALDKSITKSIFRHLLFTQTLHLKGDVLEVGVGTGGA